MRRINGSGETPPRVAYALGKRVGDAPTRNRLRRRLRAVVSELEPELVLGSAYLIAARPEAVRMSKTQIEAALTETFRALKGEA